MFNHESCGYQINEKIEDLERQVRALTEQNKKLKGTIEKAVHELERGITFCENDSQGAYEKCNIAKYSENTKGGARGHEKLSE